MKIELIKTCGACPEQYSAYFNDRLVGYLRLRFGLFTVTFPNVDGIEIYSHEFEDSWKGLFDSEDERDYFLNEAKEAIIKELER